jgi:hypothetical protein
LLIPQTEGGTSRVFENRVLRRIFGPKREGVTGEWRKVGREKLQDLFSSLPAPQFKKKRRAGHVARMGEREDAYRVLVRKSEELGRPMRR